MKNNNQDPALIEHDAGESQPWFRLQVHPVVFSVSAAVAIIFLLLCAVYLEESRSFFISVQSFLSAKMGWFYILSVNVFVLFIIYLLFSRFGKIVIGGRDCEPEFSYGGWFAMLFSAGMGIGILFYGVAEPLSHFANPPVGEGETVASAKMSTALLFYHWGIHPWAVYALVSLSLAFFAFNRGLPLTIRSVFYPLIGERIYGFWGNLIDILAVLATLFGLSTSLGIGAKQINTGLSYVFGIEETAWMQTVLIVVISAIALVSVVLGLEKGVKKLSEINMVLAFCLMLFVFVVGPTLFLTNSFLQNIGYYLQRFIDLSTWNAAYEGSGWQEGWTIFYWAWWIAWSPFVGMFIARISKGRTIKEFLVALLVVPSLVTFLWMTVFANTALHHELFGAGGLVEIVVEQNNIPVALFVLLEQLPWSLFTSVLAILVVTSFFVTSSDSGSLVVDTLTAGGSTQAPVIQRIFWAIVQGLIAIVLLVGGGLEALQTVVIIAGFPFCVVLLLMGVSLLKGLRQEYRQLYGTDR